MKYETAFPVEDAYSMSTERGMTLRDYFAAKAMQAAITGMATRRETFDYAECAALAYEQADAMLKAR